MLAEVLAKLKNAFLYAGVDRLSFERVKPKIRYRNRVMTTVLSAIATVLIMIMFISSFEAEGVKQNRIVYALGILMSMFVLMLSVTLAKKHYWMITILVYASYSIYFMYGILIGTITDPLGKTVTFMVMLVFMPTLFIDRPVHVSLVTTLYVIVFIVLCMIYKKEPVISVDILDAIIYGILGIASGGVITHMKIRGFVSESQLEEIAKIDQLTQIKNRNAYEMEKDSMPEKCKYFLGCLFIDVNDLHELNNTKGHDFGDEMLIKIAAEVKEIFTDNVTYRMGGDEFLAFVLDKGKTEIEEKVNELIRRVEENDYHIATGYEVVRIKNISIDSLVKSAEEKMREDKDAYHEKNSNRGMRNTT